MGGTAQRGPHPAFTSHLRSPGDQKMIPQDIEIKIARHARKISDRALAILCLLRLNGTLPPPDDALDEITKAAIGDLKAAGLAHEYREIRRGLILTQRVVTDNTSWDRRDPGVAIGKPSPSRSL